MPPNLPGDPTIRIAARSQRQAMDWSLVLASQGIEHVLDNTAETGWSLIVAEEEHPAALAAIRQYRVENRRWPWQGTIPKTNEVFDWLAAAWVLLTIGFYWLSSERPALQEAGIMDGNAVAGGQWWRLVTATLLHANLTHLAANAGFGFLLLGLAMGRYGTGVGLLSALLAGVGGNVVSWVVHGKTFQGLGASGVVMGALGLITVQSIGPMRANPKTWRIVVISLAAGLMLFVLLGASPDSDVIAHAGGFTTGLVLGGLLNLAGLDNQKSRWNLLALIVLSVAIISTWALALSARN
jgi:rhomboid protease GluP